MWTGGTVKPNQNSVGLGDCFGWIGDVLCALNSPPRVQYLAVASLVCYYIIFSGFTKLRHYTGWQQWRYSVITVKLQDNRSRINLWHSKTTSAYITKRKMQDSCGLEVIKYYHGSFVMKTHGILLSLSLSNIQKGELKISNMLQETSEVGGKPCSGGTVETDKNLFRPCLARLAMCHVL